MQSQDHSQLYDAYYYAHSCGRPWARDEVWMSYFKRISDRIVKEIQPESAMDAGCGMGLLVEFLRQQDVQAFGIDISEYAIQNVHPDFQSFCWVGSVSEPFPRKYDLTVCIEVVEHLPRDEAEKTISNLCKYSDDILFSSTPFDYKEATHFNVQPPDFWAETFARNGFLRDVEFDASFISPWAMRFQRISLPLNRLVRDYERRLWLLWKENQDLREAMLEMRRELVNSEERITSLENELSVTQTRLAATTQQRNNLVQGSLITRWLNWLKRLKRSIFS